VKALVAARPGEVRALRFEEPAREDLAAAIAALRARSVEAESATREELDGLAGSLHHESVVAMAAPPPIVSVQDLLDRTKARGAYLILDRITNPYNLGAIVRTAAYFGTDGIIFAEEDEQARLTPGAVRVAEGGAEHVTLARARNLTTALIDLKKRGVRLVGTDAQAEHSIFATPLPRPVAVVLGSEREGLLPAHRTRCDVIVAIPGSGKLDSLNVSVAAGIVLAEMARPPR
jgi:TrmH RNA methyltransferase